MHVTMDVEKLSTAERLVSALFPNTSKKSLLRKPKEVEMVKFRSQLEAQMVDKWRQYYLDYARLSKAITSPLYIPSAASFQASFAKRQSVRITASINADRGHGSSGGGDPEEIALSTSLTSSPNISAATSKPSAQQTASTSRLVSSESKLEHSDSDLDLDSPASNVRSRASRGKLDELSADAKEPLLAAGDSSDIHVDDEKLSFLKLLDQELDKVNNFWVSKLQEFDEHLRSQQRQVQALASHLHLSTDPEAQMTPEFRTTESLKRAFVDFYRDLMYLQSFALWNYEGFVRILKKHDLKTGLKIREPYLSVIREMDFFKTRKLDVLIAKTETIFAQSFADGNVPAAREQLLAKRRTVSDWDTFDLGMRFGIVLVFAFWALWDCIVDGVLFPTDEENAKWLSNVFPIYRGLGCLIILGWLWGVNLYVWSTFRINYLYIFELDPRVTLNYKEIFAEATQVSTVFLVNFLLYYKTLRNEFFKWIPPNILPMLLLAYLLYKVFAPWSRSSLWPALPHVYQVIISPFGVVTFMTAYVGDVLTSIIKPMVDVAYAFCFLITGEFLKREFDDDAACLSNYWYSRVSIPLISALPLWFRFMQNMRRYRDTHKRHPFLPNAGKYAVSQTIILFGVFHPEVQGGKTTDAWQALWIMSLIISTIYTSSWDVWMDWGLGDFAHKGLRERLMFHKRWVYYVCIGVDVVLRFNWTLTLITRGASGIATIMHYLNPSLAIAELCRRTMWGCFRLENEHLHNTQGYRRTDFIPMHFETTHAPAVEKKVKAGWTIVLEVVAMTAAVVVLALIAILTG